MISEAKRKAAVRALLDKACEIRGSEPKLAAACYVSQNAIWYSKQQGSVTGDLALAIHHATDGKVSASKLRPDYWPRHEYVPPAPAHPRRRRNGARRAGRRGEAGVSA